MNRIEKFLEYIEFLWEEPFILAPVVGGVILISAIPFSSCQPASAQNGEPSTSASTTYKVQSVGEVTAWRDYINDNVCYFWGGNMFCVQGD